MNKGGLSEIVGLVEKQIADFWAPDPSPSSAPKVRASTMNLVVATTEAELEAQRLACDDLALTHAGRTFLLWMDPRLQPSELEFEVSAVCRREGDAQLCFDRVELGFGSDVALRAGSVVSALALGEVPLVLEVAAGAHAGLVDTLAPLADRIVVDTARMTATRVAELSRASRASLADRSFVRSFTFRELTARFFDAEPSEVRKLRAIRLTYTPGSSVNLAAVLLGWLASRLGLHFESRGRALHPDGALVQVSLRSQSFAGLEAGAIVSIQLELETGEVLEIGRKPGTPRVVVWSRGSERHEHPRGFQDETWVMTKALDDQRVDAVYRASVLAAAEWEALG